MKNHKNYYKNIDRLNDFIETSIKIETNSNIKVVAKFRNFFRKVGNFLFGDHNWYSYRQAVKVLKAYDLKEIQDSNDLSKKINNLFKQFESFKQGKYVKSFRLEFKAKFQKKTPPPSSPLKQNTPQALITNIPPPHLPENTQPEPIPPQKAVASSSIKEQKEKEFPIDLKPFSPSLKPPLVRQPEAPEILQADEDKIAAFQEIDARMLPEVTPQLLFQIQADEFGKDSELEGLSMDIVLNYIVNYLKKRQEMGGKIADNENELIEELEKAHEICQGGYSPAIFKEKIEEAFHTNKPCLIPGGWIGTPAGHAMYYEIAPNDDGKTATFRIFNTGEGIQEHSSAYTGVKQKVAHTEWRSVEKDRLISGNFLQALHEHQTAIFIAPNSREETKYQYQDVYFGLKKILKVKNENCVAEEIALSAKLMQPQRAGVCSYRSLMAFVKSKIGTNELRRLKCDLRLQTLTTFQEIKQAPMPTSQWRLVKKSLKQLSRKIERLVEHKAVAPEYLQDAKKHLSPIKDWIKEAKKQEREIKAPILPDAITPLDPSRLIVNEINSIQSDHQAPKIVDRPNTTHLLQEISSIAFDVGTQIANNLGQAISLIKQAEEKQEFEAVYYAVIEVLGKLPLNTTLWEECASKESFDDRIKVVFQLNELGKMLFRASYEKPNASSILPEAFYCMYKLLTLQHYLTGFTTNKAPFFTDADLNSAYPRKLFLLPDERQSSEYREVSWFDWQQSDKKSPFLGSFRLDENVAVFNVSNSYYGSTNLENLIKGKDDKNIVVLNQIKQECKHVTGSSYLDLKDEERYAYLLASNHLPEWLKALRDTEIRLLFLFQATPVTLNCQHEPTLELNVVKADPDSDLYLEAKMPRYGIGDLSYYESAPPLNEKVKEFTKNDMIPTEKELLAGLNRTAEEKELEHLFLKSSVSLIETLEFFERQPEKLNDPNFQFIFESALFRPNPAKYLTQETAKIASEFIKKHLDRALIEKNYQQAAFLIRQNRYFSHFSHYREFALKGDSYLQELLEKDLLEPEIKSLLYTELLAHFAEKPPGSLSDAQKITLISAMCFIEQYPAAKKWSTPKLESDSRKAMYLHLKEVTELFMLSEKVNQEALNLAYQEITGDQSHWVWEAKSDHPYVFCTKEGHELHLLKGTLYMLNQETMIPFEIRESLEFKKLFPTVKCGIAIGSEVFQFNDAGLTVVVKMDGARCIIEKLIDGVWHRYIPKIEFEKCEKESVIPFSCFQSRFLINHYTHWQPTSPRQDNVSLLFFSEKEKTLEYQLERVAIPVLKEYSTSLTIKRVQDGAVLGRPRALLNRFEDPSYIHEWYQEGQLVEAELPRFNLSFRKNEGGKLECLQIPGFTLSQKQTVASLGTNKTHLVVEDEKGNKKVILPKLSLFSKKSSMDPIKSTVIYERHLTSLDETHFSYLTYVLEKNETLKPLSKQAELYLAFTHAVNQEYRKASKVLRSAVKLSGYLPDEIEILKEISSIQELRKDKSGEMAAIALYATYLLSLDPNGKKQAGALNDLYIKYLQRYRNITAMKLLKDEELLLLKNIIEKNNDPALMARLKELDYSYALELEQKMKGNLKEMPLIASDGNKLTNLLSDTHRWFHLRPNLDAKEATKGLITRSSTKIKRHFPEYVQIARSYGNKEQIEWLQDAARLMQGSESKEERVLGAILSQILLNPSKFEKPYTRPHKYNESWHDWWQSTLSKIEDLQIDQEGAGKTVNLAPEHFRLDKQTNDLAEFEFSYKTTPVPQIQDFVIQEDLFEDEENIKNVTDEESHEIKNWLKEKQRAVSGEDNALEIEEWKRLRADLKAYKKAPSKKAYKLISEDGVKKIETALQTTLYPATLYPGIEPVMAQNLTQVDAIKSEETHLENLKNEILNIANTFPKEDAARSLRLFGGADKKIDFGSILTSFALKDPSSVHKMNPYLAQDQLTAIYSMTAEYLMKSALTAQKKRCLEDCAKFESANPKEKEVILSRLLEKYFAKRAYDVEKHPEYLVFEHYANILMREDQVVNLESLLKGETSNPIMEMIMGSGKSKVLLPLLGLLRANKEKLSLVLVPTPLFESVATDTQKILGTAFSKSLKTLYFDRNSTFTKRSLEDIRDSLKAMIDSQQCLIMTSKSVASLLLKFIEHYHNLYEQGLLEDDKTELMKEILNIFSKTSLPLLDEADTILNVLHEVSFSLGRQRPPRQDECALVGVIFDLLYNDPEIKQLACLESDPNPDASAPPFTKKIYHEKIKAPLAKKLIDRLESEDLNDPVTTKEIRELFGSISSENKELLLNYITREENGIEQAQKYYDSLSNNLKIIFKTASDEICHLLPHTLAQICDENYGLDEKIFASPFIAATTPNKGSSFDNPNVTMNYTFAVYFKKGLSVEILTKIISDLYRHAINESISENIALSETEAYKSFAKLKGDIEIPFQIEKCTELQIQTLLDHINLTSDRKRQVIVDLILPKIEQFEKKISCNPMMLMNFYKSKIGFTGTLMSKDSMSESLTPVAEVGTDAKTLVYLWRMLKAPVEKIEKGTLEQMAASLFELEPFDMMSDAGGYFKEGGNEAVATCFSKKSAKPVVFYNERNEQTIYSNLKTAPLSESSLKEAERITFLDQSHTTGADVTQKPDASGIVTIGRNMTLRDLFQAVWRLRGLGKGQTVRYLIDLEVEAIIKEKLNLENETVITFKEILEFVIKNQCDKVGNDNFKAFKQELWAMPQHLLLDTLLRDDLSPQNKMAAFHHLQGQWIKTEEDPSRSDFGKAPILRAKQVVLKEESEKCRTSLENAKENLFFVKDLATSLSSKIAPMVERYTPKVNSKIISPISNDTETVEVENEVEVETEVEVEVITQEEPKKMVLDFYKLNDEKAREQVRAYRKLQYDRGLSKGNQFEDDFKLYKTEWIHSKPISSELPLSLESFVDPVLELSEHMETEPELKNVAPFFKGLKIAANVLQWEEGNKSSLSAKKLFDRYNTPLHHFRIDGDEVTSLTLIEEELSNYNLYLGFTKGKPPLSEAAFSKAVKFKFLNGECNYSRKEVDFLKRWFKECDALSLKQFFLNTVLKFRPDVKESFPGTALAKAFNSVLAKK